MGYNCHVTRERPEESMSLTRVLDAAQGAKWGDWKLLGGLSAEQEADRHLEVAPEGQLESP